MIKTLDLGRTLSGRQRALQWRPPSRRARRACLNAPAPATSVRREFIIQARKVSSGRAASGTLANCWRRAGLGELVRGASLIASHNPTRLPAGGGQTNMARDRRFSVSILRNRDHGAGDDDLKSPSKGPASRALYGRAFGGRDRATGVSISQLPARRRAGQLAKQRARLPAAAAPIQFGSHTCRMERSSSRRPLRFECGRDRNRPLETQLSTCSRGRLLLNKSSLFSHRNRPLAPRSSAGQDSWPAGTGDASRCERRQQSGQVERAPRVLFTRAERGGRGLVWLSLQFNEGIEFQS